MQARAIIDDFRARQELSIHPEVCVSAQAEVILKPGREKNLLQRHPWVFSGAVRTVKGSPVIGETVRVYSAEGALLGLGAWSPHSQIRVRMWTFGDGDGGDAEVEAVIRRRITAALTRRRAAGLLTPADACRLVHAESDRLPGLIVDRYAGWVVVQFLTAGAEYWKAVIIDSLAAETGVGGVYERSDVQVRSQEGLKHVAGPLTGGEPPDEVIISEGDARFAVDLRRGHKTGFYLDQRDNRRQAAEYAVGKRVLNCFCYTGGFDVQALIAGAEHVTGIDSSADALKLARRNMTLNGVGEGRYDYLAGDVFQTLRDFHDEGRTFDMIILDPPKFIESKSRFDAGCRGYKDIALSAFRLLKPGGLLATFSCSGLLSSELFQKITADAALDAGCDAQVVGRFSQGADHPVLLSFPEGSYLKGLLVRKLIPEDTPVPPTPDP